MKPGAKITIPLFGLFGPGNQPKPKIIGLRKARAYPRNDTAPPTAWRAHATKGESPWWFSTLHEEGISWCRGWSGKPVRALRAAMALE